jgi:hypothetical protein
MTSSAGNSSGTFAKGIKQLTTSGENIPNYHQRLRRGELLPLTWFIQDEHEGMAEYRHQITNTGNGYWQIWNDGLPYFPVTDATVESWLLDNSYYVQSAAARIYSSGWDTLTFMAELSKTRDMFKGALKSAQSLLEKGARKAGKNWLEARYGWRTLYYDIVDMQEALANLDKKKTRFRQSTGTTVTDEWVVETPNQLVAGGVLYVTIIDRFTVSASLRGTVVADISPPSFGFNPLTTGWEVIPFSFIVDWFVNVGQWLESLSFLVLSTQHYAAGGHCITVERNYSYVDTGSVSGWTGTVSFESNYKRIYTKRTPTSVSLNPLVKVPLDAFKITDLVSIVFQTKAARELVKKSQVAISKAFPTTPFSF